ncbi:hypothetical protein ACHAXH_003587 [Discostella pseudostelligera]
MLRTVIESDDTKEEDVFFRLSSVSTGATATSTSTSTWCGSSGGSSDIGKRTITARQLFEFGYESGYCCEKRRADVSHGFAPVVME